MDRLLDLLLKFPNAEALLLVGVLIVIPLGLRLAAPTRPLRGRWRFVARVQPIAAVALLGSFALPKGDLAGALTAPWLAFAAILALLGVVRFVERGPSPVTELAIDAALVFPVVGATWLLFSRLGQPFMGFTEPTVLHTAAYLHLAGFAPILVRGLARRLLGRPVVSRTPGGFDLLVTWMGDEVDLAAWESRPVAAASEAGPAAGDRQVAVEDSLGPEPPGAPVPKGAYEHAAAIVHRYDVFPPTLVERSLRRTPVEMGDTLGISYGLFAGIRVFFASRVIRRFDEPTGTGQRTGFSYRTLEGHPFAGEETFTVEKDAASGVVSISIRAWSRPVAFVARLTRPVMTRLMSQGVREGLAWLKQGSQW